MDNELFTYPSGKTNYEITNEQGEKTTITLDKWVADILQSEFENVHIMLQKAYDSVVEHKPELSRRKKGNSIRQMATNTANKHQKTKKHFLGWNDEDLLDLLM